MDKDVSKYKKARAKLEVVETQNLICLCVCVCVWFKHLEVELAEMH